MRENPPKTLRGPALGILTAMVAESGMSRGEIATRVGLPLARVRQALGELESEHCVEEGAPDSYRPTLDGLGAFYRTLGEIRDALAPRREEPTLPFTLRTTWRECLCFNYLVDADRLQTLLPGPATPVLKNGRGILSVTAASLANMRPAGLPEVVGKNFCHVTFRAVATYTSAGGQHRLGYVFVESLANSEVLARIGNSVTEFRFHHFRTGTISFLRRQNTLVLGAESTDGEIEVVASVDLSSSQKAPPASSAFATREELDAVVIDHADAFGFQTGDPRAYVLTIDRDPWNYRFVRPESLFISYFRRSPFDDGSAELDSVLHCRDVGYRWRPLQREATR